MAIGLYPGSFDPVTKGHVDIAERAAPLFEELVVAIYDNPPKDILFTTEERVELMRKALAHIPNVRVVSYNSLTVEFARNVKASVMVRGLRMSSDFEREFEMALMNKKLAPDCELVCLITNPKYQYLSSSLLKEVAGLSANINDLVPKPVAAALKKKVHNKP